MPNRATTIEAYLARLPAEQRDVIAVVRRLLLKYLPAGMEEGIQYGVIGYYVPHRLYPAGYHCNPLQPLPYAALAAQKNYYSLYLMSVLDARAAARFRRLWAKSGKKLDMGKCCVRFRRWEDLAVDALVAELTRTSTKQYIAQYEQALQTARGRGNLRKKAAAKSAPRRSAATSRQSAAAKKRGQAGA